MNCIPTLTARAIEICIIFSPVSAASALLTAMYERNPMSYIATLTARTIEICIIFSLVTAANALQRCMNVNLRIMLQN